MNPVATANLGNFSNSKVLKGLLLLSLETDVIGVQEGGDRRGVLETFCEKTGWRAFFGDVEGSASVAILWNPNRVFASEIRTRPCNPAEDCGSCGVGPDMVKAKVWNHIRFKPLYGGDAYVFVNGHLPASLYCKCRSKIANIMIEELEAMAAARKDRVRFVAVMDSNSSSAQRRWKPLKKLGMKQWTKVPTHGLRIIDLTWTLGVKKAKAVRFKGKYSDHRWVILRLP